MISCKRCIILTG